MAAPAALSYLRNRLDMRSRICGHANRAHVDSVANVDRVHAPAAFVSIRSYLPAAVTFVQASKDLRGSACAENVALGLQ